MANDMIQKATQNQVANADKKQPTMQQLIKQMTPGIKAALPSVMTPERFTRLALTALNSNATLQQCSPNSFLGAMMQAAQLGLEPNTPLGQAYLIPYRNHGQLECQFQVGYKGMVDLFYRSGGKVIQSEVVYEHDTFSFEYGLDPKLQHIPAKSDRGNPTHVYAVFRTKDDGYGFAVMSMNDVRAHAKKYSKAYSNGPWQTNFEEMAKKTVIKKALKYAPMSVEFQRAMAMDETVKTEISSDMYEVPAVVIESEGFTVDESTGEVVEDDKTSAN